jgi:archaellum component FlaF (FlaF/FlaG flagellin family)
VHPNPAVSYVNLRYAAKRTDNVTINIYNNTGVLLKTQRELITFSGFQTTRVNVSSLLPGTYIVQVINANGSKRIGSATFLKQ